MEFGMRKRILHLAILSSLVVAPVSFAANKNQKVEEPLRLSQDRNQLIEALTEEKVSKDLNPLTPEEIKRLKKEALIIKEAQEEQVYVPDALFRAIEVKPNNSSEMRDIYLSPNYATTLIFLDKLGNYWPIESFVLPLSEEVISRDIINTGTMVLTPKQYGKKGNLVVMLKDSKLPLMLTLNVNTKKVDYKTELRIQDHGPNSQVVSYDTSMNPKQTLNLSSQSKFAKNERIDLLNGITPESYKQRDTNNSSVEAWTNGKILFVKTKEQLLTPRLLKGDEYNLMKGADGSYLYTVPFMPEILLSVSGNIVPVRIK